MKNKKAILFINITSLYIVFMLQILWIYYVDFLYIKKENNEVPITTLNKSNIEKETEYVSNYDDNEIPDFKLISNNYSSGNYVKHYSFKGEKYDILNKVSNLEKMNIKIKLFQMINLDNNDILGEMTMEYSIKTH